jgi:Fungal specific transcription factor domain
VRCDESKPECQKCLITGRKCDGYNDKPNDACASVSSHSSLSPFENVLPREHRAFKYFLNCTAPGLAGYFSREIYSSRVPKLSLSESPLWHIVIALASVHEGYIQGILRSNRDAQLAHYSFSLKHYSLAVKSLKETISFQQDKIESVLLCCMLFVCFDSLRGNYIAASTHLNGGLNILCSEKNAGRLSPSYDKIIEQFTCIGLNTGVFMDSHLPVDTRPIWSQLSHLNSGHTPAFMTLDDARHGINMILTDIMLHYTTFQSTDDLPNQESNTESGTSIIRSKLAVWNLNFDGMILRQGPPSLSSDALRASLLLKIHHASIVAVVNGIEQSSFTSNIHDLHAPYRTIVRLARSLINAMSNSDQTRASISSDLGLVSSLFLTISRCTVEELRREALELLNVMPSREGLWDGNMVARIAIELFDIEEREKSSVRGEMKLGIKVRELRIEKREDNDQFGATENALKVDLDFEKLNRVTGQIEVVTETLFL